MNRALEGSKTTRRNLGGNDGSCQATNPIDQCWRCKKDWSANQMRLADCVLGFGAKTTDVKNGRYYAVNDSSNPDMELMMTSDKTVIDQGVEVHIQGRVGFTLPFVKNIIIHGIHIHDIKPRNGGMIRDSVQHFGLRTQSDSDGISILEEATAPHRMKIEIMQITVAFNHFYEGLIQRMPRCRFGFVHVVIRRDYAPESEWKNWLWTSEDDLMVNGAFFVESGDLTKQGSFNKRDSLVAKPGTFVEELTRFSGALHCVENTPC
ncbi:hypothetical protein Dimus_023912 [Dionaea muscipula]